MSFNLQATSQDEGSSKSLWTGQVRYTNSKSNDCKGIFVEIGNKMESKAKNVYLTLEGQGAANEFSLGITEGDICKWS